MIYFIFLCKFVQNLPLFFFKVNFTVRKTCANLHKHLVNPIVVFTVYVKIIVNKSKLKPEVLLDQCLHFAVYTTLNQALDVHI